jgi:hypothetical protein
MRPIVTFESVQLQPCCSAICNPTARMTETKRHRPLAQPAVHACLKHPQDAPDQVLAVAAARLVPADLLVALPQLACGHRPEPPALGLHVESLAGRRHRASSGCSLPRAGHSDARLGHEIKACRARFREDSLAADVVEPADAAGEEVADRAYARCIRDGVVVCFLAD